MTNEKKIDENKDLRLIINGKHYSWNNQFIQGTEIRKLASISFEEEIYLKIKEPWIDELVHDDTSIDLARPGIEHFYSKPKKFVIIVNGREKQWDERQITFVQVVILAFGSFEENQNRIFTVTFKGGPEKNPQGSMVFGDEVYVKNKMVFNVTATDKS